MNPSPTGPERRFAEQVAYFQRERGMTDENLAFRAKLDLEELKRILQGEEGIELEVIYLLAGALGVEPRTLLDGLVWVPDGKGGGGYREDT